MKLEVDDGGTDEARAVGRGELKSGLREGDVLGPLPDAPFRLVPGVPDLEVRDGRSERGKSVGEEAPPAARVQDFLAPLEKGGDDVQALAAEECGKGRVPGEAGALPGRDADQGLPDARGLQ